MNNREIDVLIATHVMGNTVVDFDTTEWLSSDYPYDGPFMQSPAGVIQFVPNYSTEIGMAWEVVQKQEFGKRLTQSDGWEAKDTFHLRFNNPGWCAGHMYPGQPYLGAENWAYAPTAPLAICLAALKANGVSLEHS